MRCVLPRWLFSTDDTGQCLDEADFVADGALCAGPSFGSVREV